MMVNQPPRPGERPRYPTEHPVTPNLRLFLGKCDELGLDASSWVYTDTPSNRLTLPMSTGDLCPVVVHDDGDEFIVDVGAKHHTHFRGRGYPDGADVAGAASDAAAFVDALIHDGVCVTVDYLAGRCIGSSHFFLDAENLTADTVRESPAGIRGGNIRTERFLWSGPV